jgi:copper chaperone CopZ
MRKTILTTIVLIMTLTVGFAQSKTETVFGVRGNCGMCKSTIEKSANNVDGVFEASWDKETKQITISYDNTKTNVMTLHKAIAKSGYDTDIVKANEKAYNNLAGCCQYDREMKLSSSTIATKSCCGGAKKSCATKETRNK